MLRARFATLILALLITALPSSRLFAGAVEEAQASAEQGNLLLKKADFEGALKAYAAAARADTTNTVYRRQYSVVKQVVALRAALAAEQDDAKWQLTARKLNAFYGRNGLHAEALPLSKRLHQMGKNADTAADLAGTYLALGENAAAEKVLNGSDVGTPTLLTRTLLGIALARQEKLEAARAIAAKLEVAKDTSAGVLYNVACVKSLTGQKQEAVALLIKAFENTPPGQLAAMKAEAKTDKDLAGAVATPEFAAALKTESKVKASSCSGGPDCGQCPSQGKCESGHDHAKAAEGKESK